MADPRDEIPEITPQVVHLIDLLKRAKEGRLRVPKFQREFIWRRQDIVDLFTRLHANTQLEPFSFGARSLYQIAARISALFACPSTKEKLGWCSTDSSG